MPQSIIVTGGNAGLGFETAKAIVRDPSKLVVVACRNADLGRQAVDQLNAIGGKAAFIPLDLSDQASIRRFVGLLREAGLPPLYGIICNAGMQNVGTPQKTVEGYETTFAVNHLGPFLLTELLLDQIKNSSPARIVNVSSTAHSSAKRGLDFDDLQSEHGYRAMAVYGSSKLANIYFTTELARRLAGTGVTANCLHPGTVATGYGRDGDTKGLLAIGISLVRPFMITPEKGAQTSVYLASSPDVADVSGEYFIKCKARTPSKAAHDRAAAGRLWEVSEKLVAAAGG